MKNNCVKLQAQIKENHSKSLKSVIFYLLTIIVGLIKAVTTKYALSIVGFAGLYAVDSFAITFKINEAITAGVTPIMTGIDAHWGKGVILGGLAGAFFGEGDLRTKAIKGGIGMAAMGAMALIGLNLFG